MDIPTLVTGFLLLPIILAPFAAFAFFAMWLDKRIEQGSVKTAVGKAVLITVLGALLVGSVTWDLIKDGHLKWDRWLMLIYFPFVTYFQWQKVKELKAKKKQISDD